MFVCIARKNEGLGLKYHLRDEEKIDIMDTQDCVIESYTHAQASSIGLYIEGLSVGNFVYYKSIHECLGERIFCDDKRIMIDKTWYLSFHAITRRTTLKLRNKYTNKSLTLCSVVKHKNEKSHIRDQYFCEQMLIQFVEKCGKYYRIAVRLVYQAIMGWDRVVLIWDGENILGVEPCSIIDGHIEINLSCDKNILARVKLASGGV